MARELLNASAGQRLRSNHEPLAFQRIRRFRSILKAADSGDLRFFLELSEHIGPVCGEREECRASATGHPPLSLSGGSFVID